MNKALNIVAVIVFLIAAAALALGYMLWDMREELKGRSDQLAEAVAGAVQAQDLQGIAPDLDQVEFTELEEQLTKFKAAATAKQEDLDQTRDQLAKTEQDLEITRGTLESAREQIAQLNLTVEEKDKRIVTLEEDVAGRDETITVLQDTNSDLAIQAAQVPALENQVATLSAENKTLVDKVNDLERIVAAGSGTGTGPLVSRPGIVGTVLQVRPDWDFVVVSLGRDDDLVPSAPLLVFRGDTLVAKLKTTDVQDEVAIADVEPGWQLADIQEGDRVLY